MAARRSSSRSTTRSSPAHCRSGTVAFVSAIGDGVLAAYLSCLEVLAPRRRTGDRLGALVRRVLAELEPRYMVDLVRDEALVAAPGQGDDLDLGDHRGTPWGSTGDLGQAGLRPNLTRPVRIDRQA